MALAVGILLCAFFLGVFAMAGVRLFLRRRRRWQQQQPPPHAAGDAEKAEPGGVPAGEGRTREPPTVYSQGATQMAGAAQECAICLTEFAEGDDLRVLPACRHGFHADCAEAWLTSSSCSASGSGAGPSCPICRASCRPPQPSPPPNPEMN
ncbi:unnamed protein product [Spirodela intermedia]|uniref:RING-type domain-containing protein n=1 Tax=Spirodela intermedia TaxID=51605 RepID=A0A7I8JU49_SPIIN|nr:unnamed protein product [Spirodela intermedia]CAA6673706.1 unnamed protein product [Spirodela intermedia]